MKRRLIIPLGLIAMVAPALAEEISATGCVATGVEASCLVLKSGDKIYNVTAAQPTPVPGTYGTVKGTLADKMSICQQGQILDPAIWEVEPGKACPVETSQ